MPSLSFEKFAELAKSYNLIPLSDEMPADLDTPVSAFLKLKSDEYDFLFESVVGGEKWGRYSFLGTHPQKVYFLEGKNFRIHNLRAKTFKDYPFTGDPMNTLREILGDLNPYEDPALPRFFGGLVGYLSYDMVRHFDAISLTNPRGLDVPDLCFLHTDTVVIFDNLGQLMKIVCPVTLPREIKPDTELLKMLYDEACVKIAAVKETLSKPCPQESFLPAPQAASPEVTEDLSKSEFMELVAKAKDYIEAGDIFQVVLSNRFTLASAHTDPFTVYRRLRRLNPSPYMFYLKIKDLAVVGASPEILVRLEDEKVTVRPIAGTRRRGKTDEEDKALENELLQDPKELAEHIMLVDLGRNDVGRVSQIGSVSVDEEKTVERYSHVMHLVSQVSGHLGAGKDAFDVIAAAFPAGTLSGAPKIRAMEIIEELEKTARGLYGGAIGYVSFTKNTDLAIAIRTAVFSGDKAVVQAGAGIVYNSDPESEYQECVNKAMAVVKAIQGT